MMVQILFYKYIQQVIFGLEHHFYLSSFSYFVRFDQQDFIYILDLLKNIQSIFYWEIIMRYM